MKSFSKHLWVAAAALVATSAANAAPVLPPSTTPPKLVMMVLIDQLRADLLDRYGDLFTGGFKRLRAQGHSYVNASHAHAATETAVGHATLSTGVYPNRHGIIANAWYESSGGTWRQVSNVGDQTVGIVGSADRPGVSPHYLMRTGLADWMTAANPQSKIASVSGKDRGAIQMAGHTKGYVYWFDSPSGRFVTSTYYRSADPDWVTALNNGKLQSHRADTVWSQLVASAQRGRSDPDTSTAEWDGVHSFFPHRYAEVGSPNAFWQWWESTPYLDQASIELAEAMVTSLQLGRDDVPDFMNVSLSATDRVGHGFGPLSREQLDNLLRLDRELGQFFDFLDSQVGKGSWTVMLTADHGVLDTPEDLVARGEYGHRLTAADNATLDSLDAIAVANPDKHAAAAKLASDLKKVRIIGDAWVEEDLEKSQPTDSFAVLQKRSQFPGREDGRFAKEGVQYRYIPGILVGARGSSHGQTYWYDRHVPMIFMGPGIPAGKDASRAETVDFAPTFATLLGIPYPKDLDGKVLSGVVAR